MLEIERRFVMLSEEPVKYLSSHLKEFNPVQINQFYAEGFPYRLRITQDKDGREVFYQTIKIGKGLIRKEVEVELTRFQFGVLFPLASEIQLVKTRVDYKGVTFDIFDVNIETKTYKGPLVFAEIEFKNPEEANKYHFTYFSIEITDLVTSYMLAKDFKGTVKLIENLINQS